MSQNHTQPSHPRTYTQIASWKLVLCFAAVVTLVAILYFLGNWMQPVPSVHKTAEAKILEIRKVVDHTSDSQFGSKIYYRYEAHVQFTAGSQTQDRWLRIANDVPVETLLLKLANHPTHCLAYWVPHHIENAQCSLK